MRRSLSLIDTPAGDGGRWPRWLEDPRMPTSAYLVAVAMGSALAMAALVVLIVPSPG